MKARHWVEDDALQRTIARALEEARRRRLNNEMRAALLRRKVDEFLSRQPLGPDLVGVAAAAEMIDVPKPRIARLRDQGRLPEPMYDLPSGPLWPREDIREVADAVAEARAERARRVAAGEAPPAEAVA